MIDKLLDNIIKVLTIISLLIMVGHQIDDLDDK